jgi:hypothetical protein
MLKQRLIALIGSSVLLAGCQDRNIPDVSHIDVKLNTLRFEQSMFDTAKTNLIDYLDGVKHDMGSFPSYFVQEILAVDPRAPRDSQAVYVNGFITAYRSVYDSAAKLFAKMGPIEQQIREGLQRVNYHFPKYALPEKLITYIGPADGYGDIIIPGEALVVGLQHHLGASHPLYQSELVQRYYPAYISARFTPDYIPVNAMRNIVMDLFPEQVDDAPLLNQMIEKGKRLFVLQSILPREQPWKLIGYTEAQYNDCLAHESGIWNLFVKNNLLQVIDRNLVRNYLDEGPKTPELGDAAPGNIGSFAGWQIVQAYMNKHSDKSLSDLMATDTETIFREAKYKP